LRERYEGQVRAHRETQKEIEAKLGTKDGNLRSRIRAFVEQQLAMTERELLHTQSDLRKARLELSVLEGQEKDINDLPVPEAAVKDDINQHPEVQKLLAESRRLQTKIQDAITRAERAENDPAVLADRGALRGVEKALAEVSQRVRPEVVGQL